MNTINRRGTFPLLAIALLCLGVFLPGGNAVAQTYSVSEADHTLNFHIESSSFPNWNGTDQKRAFTLTEDELTYTSPGSSGGTAHVVWKRAR